MNLSEEIYGSIFTFIPLKISANIFSSIPELSKSILVYYPFLIKKPDFFYNFSISDIKLLLRNQNIDRDILLMHVSKRGLILTVKILINDKKVNPKANNNYAITRASEYGHLSVVKLLLKVPNINPTEALKKAFQNKHFKITKILFTHPKILNNVQTLVLAAKSGNIKAVKFLITKNINTDIKIKALIGACEYGHTTIVSILCKLVIPNSKITIILLYKAIYYKYYNIVMLLLKITNLKADTKAIFIAATKGHILIMKILLESNKNNQYDNAIYEASKRNHPECLKLLLNECNILTISNIKRSLFYASTNGSNKIVSILLPLVDLNSKQYSFMCGVENGHTSVVKTILKEPKIDINDQDNRALRCAKTKGYSDIINILTS